MGTGQVGRRHSEKNKNQDEQRNKTEKANAGGLLKRAHGPIWEDARRVDRIPGVSSGDGPGRSRGQQWKPARAECAQGSAGKPCTPVGRDTLRLLTFAPGFSVWLLFILLFCFRYTESIVLGIRGLRDERMTICSFHRT